MCVVHRNRQRTVCSAYIPRVPRHQTGSMAHSRARGRGFKTPREKLTMLLTLIKLLHSVVWVTRRRPSLHKHACLVECAACQKMWTDITTSQSKILHLLRQVTQTWLKLRSRKQNWLHNNDTDISDVYLYLTIVEQSSLHLGYTCIEP